MRGAGQAATRPAFRGPQYAAVERLGLEALLHQPRDLGQVTALPELWPGWRRHWDNVLRAESSCAESGSTPSALDSDARSASTGLNGRLGSPLLGPCSYALPT